MTNLIEDWLNNEVKLSKKITKIEEDFSNGFLFGELLHRYQQISNFIDYKNKEDHETKVSNLKNVETSLRDLNVKLDKGRIFDILNQKRGVAARYLYQIKMFLSKKCINFENLMSKKAPDTVQAYSKTLYPRSNFEQSRANNSLSRINKNQNFSSNISNINSIPYSKLQELPSINVDNQFLPNNRIYSSINPTSRKAGDLAKTMPAILNTHNTNNNFFLNPIGNNLNNTNYNIKTDSVNKLKINNANESNNFYLDPIRRFEEFQKTQTKKIIEDENKQIHYFKVEHMKNKENIRSNEKDFHLKKIKEDQIEKANWLKDIEVKNNFEKKVEEEKYHLANTYKKFVIESINKTEKSSFIEIDKFEKNLTKLGLDITSLDPKLKKTGKNVISSEMVLQKIKEKIKETELAKKEKERRKRKILLDQSKLQQDLKLNNNESANFTSMNTNEKNNLNDTNFNMTTNQKSNNVSYSIGNNLHPNHNLQINYDSVLAKRYEYEKVRDLHNRKLNKEIQRKKNDEMINEEGQKEKDSPKKNIYVNPLDKKGNIFSGDYNDNFDAYKNPKKKHLNQKFVKEEFLEELYKESLDSRQKDLERLILKRNNNIPQIKRLSNFIIDLVEEIYNFQTEKNTDQIPLDVWTEYTTMFIKKKSFNSAKYLHSNYFEEAEEEDENNINNVNSNNYINFHHYNNNLIMEEEDENSIFRNSYINNNDENINLLNLNENNVGFDKLNSKSNHKLKSGKHPTSKDSFINESLGYIKINDYLPLAQEIYEDNELFDYIYLLGNFKDNIIPNEMFSKMLDYFDVMKSSTILTGKRNSTFAMKMNYGQGSKTDTLGNPNILNNNILYGDYELKDEDIENLTIPQSNCKNYYFSDIINIIMELKLKENNYNSSNTNNVLILNNQKINFNNMNNNSNNSVINPFSHIPLKLSILGKDYSGKKTQLKLLSENFNLKIYNIDELITRNLELMERLEIPLENNPKYKTLKKAEIEKFMADRQVEEQKLESIKEYLVKIKESINNQQEIDDDLLIDFLIENIKMDFPEKPQEKIIEEIAIKFKRKKELTDEIAKIKEEKLTTVNVLSNPTPKEKSKKPIKDNNVNDTKTNEAHLNNLIQELHQLNTESNKGFVVVNFPKNQFQAKKLEKKLCNYVSEIEKPKNLFDHMKDSFFILLDKIIKPHNNQGNQLSFFDSLLYLEYENEEMIRRAKNRKLDPTTGIIYHMEDNPPSAEDKKLIERLNSLDETPNLESLNNAFIKFDDNIKKLRTFYTPFVNSSSKLNLHYNIFNKVNLKELIFEMNKNTNLNNLLQIDSDNILSTNENNHMNVVKNTITSGGGKSTTNLTNLHKERDKEYKSQINLIKHAIENVLNKLIQINDEKENDVFEKYNLDLIKEQSNLNNLTNNNNQILSNSSMTSKHVTINIAKEGNSNSNQNNNVSAASSFRKDNINTPNNNNINNNQTINTSKEKQQRNNLNIQKEFPSSNNLPNPNSNNGNNFTSNNNINNLLVDAANSFSNFNSSNIQNNIFLEEYFNNYNKKFEEAKRKLSTGLVEKIFSDWSKIYENFTKNTKQIFRNIHKQKEGIVNNFNKVQNKFIEFLVRPSDKLSYAGRLQAKYNRFTEEYPQLKSDEKVKEEFHQDVCEVEDRIWETIQNRKTEAINERQKIMDCGYIEKEMEKFYKNYLEKLFVLETEKFYSSILILRDFYSNLDMKINTEFFTFKPLEILLDQDLEKLPVFKEKSFNENEKFNFDIKNINSDKNAVFDSPKIDKLYKNSIKMLIKYDEIKKSYEKNLKSQFQFNMNISSDSMAIRKVSKVMKKPINQDSIFSDERKDLLSYEEELKSAIKQEKNKYKYRITFLKYWGLNYLQKIKDLSKTIYDKLDEWIINTIKMENDAMNALTNYLDACIEKQVKIKVEKELDVFDIYRAIDAADYFEISSNNQELPFRDLEEKTSIDLDKFVNIFYEIKSYEIYPGYIRSQIFKDIFISKNFLELKSNGIPSIFKFLSSYNFNKFIKNFENVALNLCEDSYEKIAKRIKFNDVINIKDIFTILLIIESKIINESNLSAIIKQAESKLIKNNYLNKDDYMSIEFWYERDPSVNIKTINDEFFIPSKIKLLIYDINKEENELINLMNLLQVFKLKILQHSPNLDELVKANKTYGEYLFL